MAAGPPDEGKPVINVGRVEQAIRRGLGGAVQVSVDTPSRRCVLLGCPARLEASVVYPFLLMHIMGRLNRFRFKKDLWEELETK